jgi:uncharacterized protein (TIGR03437 family)
VAALRIGWPGPFPISPASLKPVSPFRPLGIPVVSQLWKAEMPVSLTIEPKTCFLYSAGFGFAIAGVDVFAITIPANAPNGDDAIRCTYNGVATPAGNLISVHN